MAGIIGAAITAVASVICQLIIARNSSKQTKLAHEEGQRLIEYKIDKLTERVDKHNNLIERTYRLEERAEVTEEKIRVANHRIEDLEKAGGK